MPNHCRNFYNCARGSSCWNKPQNAVSHILICIYQTYWVIHHFWCNSSWKWLGGENEYYCCIQLGFVMSVKVIEWIWKCFIGSLWYLKDVMILIKLYSFPQGAFECFPLACIPKFRHFNSYLMPCYLISCCNLMQKCCPLTSLATKFWQSAFFMIVKWYLLLCSGCVYGLNTFKMSWMVIWKWELKFLF